MDILQKAAAGCQALKTRAAALTVAPGTYSALKTRFPV